VFGQLDGGIVSVFGGSPTGGAPVPFASFQPFAGFLGGVNVAGGDVDGDGFLDVIAAPASGDALSGGGPRVSVFSGRTGQELVSFFAFDTSFIGGVRVAAGDIDGDGNAEIVVAGGSGGGPHVRVFDGVSPAPLADFAVFPGFTGGVSVAAGDLDSDGVSEIVVGANVGGGALASLFSPAWALQLDSFPHSHCFL
jgi:hypothetical protein